MTAPKTPPIIHVIGPPGSGKTTLCRMFCDAFQGRSVLAVDGTPDGYLALSYGVEHPKTLGELIDQLAQKSVTREAVDWMLQDLPIPVAAESEAEVLALGTISESLSDTQISLMAYGLPRMLGHYDVVMWDGDIQIPRHVVNFPDVRHLAVITPQDEAYCQSLLGMDHAREEMMILLDKAESTDRVPDTAVEQIREGHWRFLGKLPPLNPPEKRIRELPAYFQECFHKLDLPFTIRAQS